jgi:hypothetical protein
MSHSHPSSVFLASPYSRLVSLSCYYSKHGKTRRVFLFRHVAATDRIRLLLASSLYPPEVPIFQNSAQMRHSITAYDHYLGMSAVVPR